MTKLIEEEKVTAKGTLRRSKKFYNAFLALNSDDKIGKFFPVEHYLLAHSIKLALKSILIDKGFPVKNLLSLGHDLEAIVKEVEKTGVCLTIEDLSVLKLTNKMYKSKEFEYFVKGSNFVPKLKDLLALSTKIFNSPEITKIES